MDTNREIRMEKRDGILIIRRSTIAQQAVWQNGGFGAFLEAKVLKQSSGIFSNFGAEKPPLRQAAGRWR